LVAGFYIHRAALSPPKRAFLAVAAGVPGRKRAKLQQQII
jgi:hypothetical protein